MSIKVFILLPIVFYTQISGAKETWLQFVGIDRNNPAQNYYSFYKAAKDFETTCVQKKDRVCTNYMNLDSTLVSQSNDEKRQKSLETIEDFKKNPRIHKNEITREQALATIRNALKSAGTNDQILISLQNHGGPVTSERDGKSCLYLNESECISDADIAKLIKENPLPKGAKVALIADGCYSGGFHDLMSENVCVATTADQYFIGYGSDKNFWTYITEQKIKKFSDISSLETLNPQTHYQSFFRSSKEVYEERKCLAARKSLNSEEIKNLVSWIYWGFRQSSEPVKHLCSTSGNSLNMIEHFGQQLMSYEQWKGCSDIDRVSLKKKEVKEAFDFCAFKKRLVQILKNKKDEITKLDAYKRLLLAQKEFDKLIKYAPSMTPEQKEVVDYLYLLESPTPRAKPKDYDKLSSSQLLEVTNLVKLLLDADRELHKMRDIFASSVAKNKIDQFGEVDEDLQLFYNCFLYPDIMNMENDDTIKYWNRIAAEKEKKIFSKEDIKRAQKCENSFTF